MDFRLFSGIRLTLAKPTYNADLSRLKQQVRDYNINQIDPSSGMPETLPKENPPSSQPQTQHPQVPSGEEQPKSLPENPPKADESKPLPVPENPPKEEQPEADSDSPAILQMQQPQLN